jgi:hypothetical protein
MHSLLVAEYWMRIDKVKSRLFWLREISDSQGGEHEDVIFWVVATCSLVDTFRRF